MKKIMSNQVSLVDDIVSEYQGIEMQMADPEVAGDQKQFRKLSKRYAELQLAERTGAKIRKSLESYTSSYLRFVWTLSATAVVVCYGLWAFYRDGPAGGSWFAVSMIPFTIAILRYAVDVDSGAAGEPEEIVLNDRVLQLLGVALVATLVAAILPGLIR